RHLQAVKRPVDLERREGSARKGEFVSLPEPGWIEIAAPRGIGPTRNPDVNHATAGMALEGRNNTIRHRPKTGPAPATFPSRSPTRPGRSNDGHEPAWHSP